jgi:hypothetical protein
VWPTVSSSGASIWGVIPVSATSSYSSAIVRDGEEVLLVVVDVCGRDDAW